MVRDEMGNPFSLEGATVILETPSGVSITAEIVPGLGSGTNYKLAVPVDTGVTTDAYRANALRAAVPFKLRVRTGKTIHLPIEMSGDFAKLGQPAESIRVDLTLGEDSNNNGLPDAWERALIAASGGKLTVIDPDEDPDNDGLTSLQEYQAGTFAFDINDGFSLKMLELKTGNLALEFMSIRGRTYTVFASSNLDEWELVPFRLAGDGASLPDHRSYQAVDSKVVQVSVSPPPGQPALRFFKLRAE
jgi:hypothetical protein